MQGESVTQVLNCIAPATAPEPPSALDEDVVVVDVQVVQDDEQTEGEIEAALRALGC